jgi:hypothetical protein
MEKGRSMELPVSNVVFKPGQTEGFYHA